MPSATDGRVWLAGLDCDRARMAGAREVTVDGRVTAESRRRVPGTWVAAAARSGLVIQRGRSLLVWDPSTGRTVRRLPLDVVTDGQGDLMIGCTTRRAAATSRSPTRRPPAPSWRARPAGGGSTSAPRSRRTGR